VTARIAVIFVIIIAALVVLRIISLDTFTDLWQSAFVVAVKAAVFAMIPCGFLVAIYVKLQG